MKPFWFPLQSSLSTKTQAPCFRPRVKARGASQLPTRSALATASRQCHRLGKQRRVHAMQLLCTLHQHLHLPSSCKQHQPGSCPGKGERDVRAVRALHATALSSSTLSFAEPTAELVQKLPRSPPAVAATELLLTTARAAGRHGTATTTPPPGKVVGSQLVTRAPREGRRSRDGRGSCLKAAQQLQRKCSSRT
jgi:hypothetical protein